MSGRHGPSFEPSEMPAPDPPPRPRRSSARRTLAPEGAPGPDGTSSGARGRDGRAVDGQEAPRRPRPSPRPAAQRQGARGPVGLEWLVGLMAANTVAAVGLFGDIARHVTIVGVVEEDFLAGWHLVLYGGVAGVALVLGLLALQEGPDAPGRRLPSAAGGLALLTLGGILDALWHEAFGVEAAFTALVSPPHLVVLLGLVLLMVAPIGALAREREPLDRPRSVILALSVTSLLLVISLFTGYLTPLIGGSELQAGAYVEPLVGTSFLDIDTARGLATVLWFSALTSLAVVVTRTRVAPLPGTWTVAFGVLGLAPLIATGTTALPLTLGLLALGAVTDLTSRRGRPHPVATGLAGAAMWAVVFGVIGLRGDLVWLRELWMGAITTSFLVGLAVGGAIRWVAPAPRRRPPPPGTAEAAPPA